MCTGSQSWELPQCLLALEDDKRNTANTTVLRVRRKIQGVSMGLKGGSYALVRERSWGNLCGISDI